MSLEEPERLELLGALAECAQNKADLKALITELCDALSYFEPLNDNTDLIQRAREATR